MEFFNTHLRIRREVFISEPIDPPPSQAVLFETRRAHHDWAVSVYFVVHAGDCWLRRRTELANGDPPRQLPTGTVAATRHPLVAQYTISPPAAAKVTVEFSPDLTYALSTSPQATASTGGPVTVLVAGMKQNTTYHMRALVTYSDGSQQLDSDHTFQTGAIPPQRIPTIS